MTYHALVSEFKRRLIAHALAASGGSVSGAAGLLGLRRQYLYELIRPAGVAHLPYRCACGHWWGQHRAGGCGVTGCACQLHHRARAASTTQHVRTDRPPADTRRP